MRIAIDARMMGPLQTRGIGRYIEELVRAMIKEAPSDWKFVLLVQDLAASPFQGASNVEHIAAPVAWYGLEEQTRMPRFFKQAKADLVHIPHWNVPFLYRKPFVVTIHDLLLMRQQASSKVSTLHPWKARIKYAAYRQLVQHVLNTADQILVPTQYVAKDVIQHCPSAEKRVMVTGEGLTSFPAPDLSRVPKTPFLFYVGSAYPHKRLDLLIEAWPILSARHLGLQLVIAGEKDVFMKRQEASVLQQGLSNIQFPGRLSDAELAGFFDQAQAFVFPSSEEGFGLPPLEALSRGCPVISSDSTCLPEVLPKMGVTFFRDGRVDDMIRAVDTVLGDQGMRQQAQLGGREANDRHRWSLAAQRTLAAYERVGK